MANTRELSQLASLINVVDENKSIGIVTSHPNANVGVGTLSPTSKVDVVGNVNVSGVVTATSFYGDGSNLIGIAVSQTSVTYTPTSGVSTNVSGGTASVTSLSVSGISTLGNVQIGIGDTTLIVDGNTEVTGILTVGTTLYSTELTIQNINSSGIVTTTTLISNNVGVGTTNPQYNLDIVGDVNFTGTLRQNGVEFSTATQPGKNSETFTATSGQTTFTVSGGYSIGFIDVFLNGIRLSDSEFTASNGTTVVLNVGASENDILDIIEYTMGVGETGPQGTAGPLSGILSTTTDQTYYPIMVSGIGTVDPYIANKLSFNPSTGTLTATDINSSSDINLKENIKSINNPIENIMKLNGIKFDWKETKQSSIGIIAQELEEVFPELVKTGDIKSVNYNGLIAVLIEGMKKQQQQINTLMNRIKNLEEGLK